MKRDAVKLVLPGLLITFGLILLTGLFNLYSATRVSMPSAFWKQIVWIIAGLLVSAPFVLLDYRIITRLAPGIWAFVVLLLSLVWFFPAIKGSHRWIDLGPLNLQPSEFAKLAVIFAASACLADTPSDEPIKLRKLIMSLAYILIPVFLIAAEPDLGTSLLVLSTGMSVVFVGGISRRLIVILLILLALTAPIVYSYGLQDYQKDRITSLLSGGDPKGAGYHAYQSLIAVGSGRVDGKGYLKGTQNQMRFVPEQHTDFVFAVFAEEFGFVGSVIFIIVYAGFLIFCIIAAYTAREKFGMLLCAGISGMFLVHFFVNIGMVINLLPVVGVTLSFMSYGGSSLLFSMICVALMVNVNLRRQNY